MIASLKLGLTPLGFHIYFSKKIGHVHVRDKLL